MVKGTLNSMCSYYKEGKYSGALCEELCNGDYFKEFKCPENRMKTAVFTAVKNHYTYSFQIAKEVTEPLAWTDRQGRPRYPHIKEFQSLIKRHIAFAYNVTIDEDVIKALLSQEINSKSPEQMESIWRMFRDNNYVMSKLFEEESVFPVILGSCGPYYATEHLKAIHPSAGIRQYISVDWIGRLKFALDIMDYLQRMDEVKPEPLKMCKILPNEFGITIDKRIKYKNAQYIHTESQIDKIISDGSPCEIDSDCRYEHCLGKCDPKLKMCTGIQQNNNLQIVCQHIFKGHRYLPGILATSKAPQHLKTLIDICVDSSENPRHHLPSRQLTPSPNIAAKLYNEIKRVYNEETFRQ
ncbi:unnamed protein product [Hermetia illucens]|uniref:FAM69 protein-kinase domain-containing protein n=2 Tax=Hermetia illucens TaxID=343691 RepID=A0A7R8YRV7_HERIL|nr:unnamed protein product [Hermetia illucens]